MALWTLQPRDPLLARDGKPFSAEPGAKAKSLALPSPSMLAGAWRSWLGQGPDGLFQADRASGLMAQGVRGPLLVARSEEGPWQALAPLPLDAFAEGKDKGAGVATWHRLHPAQAHAWPQGAATDLTEGARLVAFKGTPPQGKAAKGVAPYWSWACFEAWLLGQEAQKEAQDGEGYQGPVAEGRQHVGLQPGTRVSDDGALFFTEARAYESKEHGKRTQFALAFDSDAPGRSGLMPVGGERRLAAWQEGGCWPQVPAALLDAVAKSGRARVVLLTPAAFDAGALPSWLLSGAVHGVRGQVVASVVGRPWVHSGWRFDPAGGPGEAKPTRRFAPAGSVYWVQLEGDEASRRAWAEALWLQGVSDQSQDRLDGFGLAALGVWED